MFKKFLLSVFLLGFVFACSTTPKDTADSSGSGSSGEFNTSTTTSAEMKQVQQLILQQAILQV